MGVTDFDTNLHPITIRLNFQRIICGTHGNLILVYDVDLSEQRLDILSDQIC